MQQRNKTRNKKQERAETEESKNEESEKEKGRGAVACRSTPRPLFSIFYFPLLTSYFLVPLSNISSQVSSLSYIYNWNFLLSEQHQLDRYSNTFIRMNAPDRFELFILPDGVPKYVSCITFNIIIIIVYMIISHVDNY